VVLTLLLSGILVFWVGRKVGRRRVRSQLAQLRDVLIQRHRPNVPAFELSPTEHTPLTAPDAWQSQPLHVPEPSPMTSAFDNDEFAYFESKLARPLPFKFPRIDSALERISGIPHRLCLDKALFPHKEALSCETPDEYKAILDIRTIQTDLNTNILYLDELRRSLDFLKMEQRGASQLRADRIKPGVNLKSVKLALLGRRGS